MCGLLGICNLDKRPIQETTLKRISNLIKYYRDEGYFTKHDINLENCCLYTIDFSKDKYYPMSNENKTIWVTYNGEIHNYIELKDELQNLGYKFKPDTNAEVIIHFYEQWNKKCFEKLDGMFTLIIWDSQKNELILARDKIGQKPLFYLEDKINSSVYFASDIKLLWQLFRGQLNIDFEAIDCYLHFYYIPTQHTIFKEIKKVSPAHYIVFSKRLQNSAVRYWLPDFKSKLQLPEKELLNLIEKSLETAIKKSVIGNDPVGVFLSGGVDSSIITAITAKLSCAPVKSFSIGFQEADFNELHYANLVAKQLKTEHHQYILKMDTVLDFLPNLIWAYGEPFADSSAIATFYLSQEARKSVKVALSGEGGDELFAGYSFAREAKAVMIYNRIFPVWVRTRYLPSLANILIYFFGRRSIVSKFKTLTEFGHPDIKYRFTNTNAWPEKMLLLLYSKEFKDKIKSHAYYHIYDFLFPFLKKMNIIEQSIFIDILTALPDDYLTKVDRASISNFLEVKVPFLGQGVVELSMQIPADLKIKFGQPKYLLKKLGEGLFLPKSILYREKMGFGVPLKFWFCSDKFSSLLEKILFNGSLEKRGYFNQNYLRNIVEEHLKGKKDHTHRIWTIFCLELWHRMFIDNTLKKDETFKRYL